MYDSDQVNDDALLRELRDTLSSVAMPVRPALETITAKGSARRRHRFSGVVGLSLAGAAAATALAIGLPGAHGLGPAPAGHIGVIRTAAFTIAGNANGTATLTINTDVLFEPATLQKDLAQFGIPAVVTLGSFCTSDPAPDGFSQVVPFPLTNGRHGQTEFTINPAAIPSGTELSFGNFRLHHDFGTQIRMRMEQQTLVALINTSNHTCTDNPHAHPSGAEMGFWEGTASVTGPR